jgi:uncharacterized protein (DUF2164 family)
MTIEISKDQRNRAIVSIERYFSENMEEKIGNIAAGALLGFILEEIGPTLYNQGVTDTQKRLQILFSDLEMKLSEIDIEVHEDEFDYWRKYDKQTKAKR